MLRDCRGEADIIKEAYGMARDYIVAMDTPYRVTLRLSPEANCTDSKVVYLATRVFDDADLSDGQKIDTFVGLAVHEGCHLKYTDFSQMASEPNGIVRNLINVLEDERIERLCGEQMPGYANFLKATKYYMFDLYRQRKMEEAQRTELPKQVRLLNAILAIIRYPKALGDADLGEFAEVLYDVREVVLDYPATPAAVTSAAKDIYEIIKKYFEKEEQSGRGDEGGEGSSSQSEDRKDGKGSAGAEKPSQGESREEENGQGNPSSPGGDIEKAVEQALSELEEEMESMGEIT
jgi:hypothetical protein